MGTVYTAFHLLESVGELFTQSMDTVYTAFHLLESVGELLTQSTQKRSMYLNFVCLFTKSKICFCAATILMQALEEYLDIHNDIFQTEGAMME